LQQKLKRSLSIRSTWRFRARLVDERISTPPPGRARLLTPSLGRRSSNPGTSRRHLRPKSGASRAAIVELKDQLQTRPKTWPHTRNEQTSSRRLCTGKGLADRGLPGAGPKIHWACIWPQCSHPCLSSATHNHTWCHILRNYYSISSVQRCSLGIWV